MSVISFRFKYQFACFATANHLLNKQLLYLCTVPHFTFKLCVCFTPNSLLWSIINNFAESRALHWREAGKHLKQKASSLITQLTTRKSSCFCLPTQIFNRLKDNYLRLQPKRENNKFAGNEWGALWVLRWMANKHTISRLQLVVLGPLSCHASVHLRLDTQDQRWMAFKKEKVWCYSLRWL